MEECKAELKGGGSAWAVLVYKYSRVTLPFSIL